MVYHYISRELLIPAVAWFVAQFAKCVVNLIVNKKVSANIFFGSGGMPSSHSATACALATVTGMDCGTTSALFGITCIFAFIVMYDAMNVRLETGNQGKVINEIITLFEDMGKPISIDKKFKELVGHTPLQVVIGALTGIVIGAIMMQF